MEGNTSNECSVNSNSDYSDEKICPKSNLPSGSILSSTSSLPPEESIPSTPLQVHKCFEQSSDESDEYTIDKPIIYLYPKEETDCVVHLETKSKLIFVYPKFDHDQEWKVHAYPNGILVNSRGRHYKSLFWEAEGCNFVKIEQGFIVRGKETEEFLEESLEKLGLNEIESGEFITYWVPKMMKNNFNLISFQFENYEKEFCLHVSPSPDCIIRVFMAFQGLESKEGLRIEKQELVGKKRKGF
jgi:hypothetical protein